MGKSRFKKKFAGLLPRTSFARSVSVLVGGSAAAQLITIGAMPIVTRLYSPADIGIVSLFIAFFGFWAATLSLRYESALMIAKSDEESHLVHRLAIIVVFVMAILGLPLLWILKQFNVLGFGALPGWAPVLAMIIFMCHGSFMVNRSWALRAGLIKKITQAAVAKSGANAATRVCIGFFGGGIVGLFLAELAGASASMMRLTIAVHRHFSPTKPATYSRKKLTEVARRYARFPLIETPSTWMDCLASALPLPMMASLYGVAMAGFFGLSRMLVAIPNSQIGGAVADVFQMELANAVIKNDGKSASNIFYATMRRMALFGLIPLSAVLLLSGWLVPLIFGSAWAVAGQMAMVIAPWFYAALIVAPLSRSVSVLQAQEFKIIYDVFSIIILLTIYFTTVSVGLSWMYFLSFLSGANVIGYIIYAMILSFVIKKRFTK